MTKIKKKDGKVLTIRKKSPKKVKLKTPKKIKIKKKKGKPSLHLLRNAKGHIRV